MTQQRFVTSALAAAVLLLGGDSSAQGGYWEAGPEPAEITSAEGIQTRVFSSDARINALYVAPLSLLLGNIPVEYERAVAPWLSLAVVGSVNSPNGFLGLRSREPGTWYPMELVLGGAARAYFFGTALSGLFAGPEVDVGYSSGDAPPDVPDLFAVLLRTRFLVGYSIVTSGGFAFSVGAGVEYKSVLDQSPEVVLQTRPLIPALRVNLGYAF